MDRSVFVDITHMPHVNFFKNAIKILRGMDIGIELGVRPRAALVDIVRTEYPDLPLILCGKHRASLIANMLDMLRRDISLMAHLRKSEFDVATCIGGFNGSHVAYARRKPSVVFSDDVETKLANYPYECIATYIVRPAFTRSKGKRILTYNGFKELAYLHPNYFVPNRHVLDKYNVQPGEYVFIREVSNTTINYRHLQEGSLVDICPSLKQMGFKIILSLENKALRPQFENECIILEEPVNDIHSVLHYAALAICSGDSMAREACLVGTPAIYTGGRVMSINSGLLKKGCFFAASGEQQILDIVGSILSNSLKEKTQRTISEAIETEWVDTTEVIVNCLLSAINNDVSLIEKYMGRN
ncbi:MAG: DUF354 domain-containing protein [Chloroflexi bacterium]|jgi:uncharacterized protein|nr:DUF354 domain-containing protein [Chloroflexota bacterium]